MERPTQKTSVRRSEYLQLVGLLLLANRHNDALQNIEDAIAEITGEGPGSHSADAVYCNYSAEKLLNKLNITIAEEAAQSPIST